MASNDFLLGVALQSGKDQIPDNPQWLLPVRSTDIKPNRETAQMEQTGSGRDGGKRFVTVISASGNFEIYVFPTILPLIDLGVLGANSTSLRGTVWAAGSTYAADDLVRPTNTTTNPYTYRVTVGGVLAGTATEPPWANATAEGSTLTHEGITYENIGALKYAHKGTPANDQPYFTIWRFFQSDGLFEKFHNVKFTSSNFSGTAGQMLTVQVGVQGLRTERVTAQPAGGTLIDEDPLRVPNAVYHRQNVENDAIREWNLNVTANQEAIQTNKLYYSYIMPGQRNVEFNFTEVFRDLDLYNEILYGSAAGTEVSEKLKETEFKMLFGDKFNGPGQEFLVPRLQYLAGPLDPSAGGEPLQLQVTGAGVPPRTGPYAGNSVIGETYNEVASYPAAAAGA